MVQVHNRNRLIRNVSLAAACVVLLYISVRYQARFFGVPMSASLVHFHTGLLLAIAMLVRDPWALRLSVAALVPAWLIKSFLEGSTAWQELLAGTLTTLLGYALLRWTARRMGWPRSIPGLMHISDVLRFLFYGTLLLPALVVLTYALLHAILNATLVPSPELTSVYFQSFLAKFFGVSIVTLPIVLLACYRTPGKSNRGWLTTAPWPPLILGVLVPSAAMWLSASRGIDPTPLLDALLEYRLLVAAIMVLAVLRLDPMASMPLLVLVNLLLAMALSQHFGRASYLPDVADMFRVAVECLLLESLTVFLFMHSREREAASEQHERDSRTEPLTGLHNLTALRSRAAHTSPPSIGFLLLDRMERVTAELGLQAESRLLRSISHQLNDLAHVFYIGTGRLALILKEDGKDPLQSWNAVLEHMLAFEFAWGAHRVRMLPYLGISGPEARDETIDQRLLLAANVAYDAQQRGELRLLHSLSNPAVAKNEEVRPDFLHRSSTALSRVRSGEVELYFQRIFPLAPHLPQDLLAGEVLCRMRDSRGHLISPVDFINELQADHRLAELDLAVVRKLNHWLSMHADRLPPLCRISVNIAAQSLASHEFANKLLRVLDNFSIPLSYLCIEITETAAITHIPDSMELVSQLRARGCELAVDDFGVGYQSFDRLKQLPVTIIKIDGSLVREMTRSARDYALIQAAVHAARAFGAATVAEFVEDAKTVEALRELKVDWAQGYFYGRPEPIDDFLVR